MTTPAASLQVVESAPRVRNLVRYLAPGDRMVDEVAQEAPAPVLRGLAGYRGDAPLLSWGDRIAVRTAFERRRREQTKEGSALPADDAGAMHASAPDLALARHAPVHAREAMNAPQCDAIVRHHVVGMGVAEVAEVAEVLGVPAEAVQNGLGVGVAQFRKRLSLAPSSVSGEEVAPCSATR
jgi:DNA-directed RNA polymerase specialized sigma24 family protein